jgi:nicotinamidase-related amidase
LCPGRERRTIRQKLSGNYKFEIAGRDVGSLELISSDGATGASGAKRPFLSGDFYVAAEPATYKADLQRHNRMAIASRQDEPKESTMLNMRNRLRRAAVAAGLLLIAFAASSSAADILDDWAAVKPPPLPDIKPVTVEGSTTALLILDMMKSNCGARPRCVATVPNVKRLYDAARGAKAMVWYSLIGSGMPTPADMIDPGFAPRDGEWVRQNGPDKFLGSNLEETLKTRGIKTVIVCGTSFQGVGIGTGSGLAQRGYKVIVPLDCVSSEDPYMEQYSAWHLFKGGPAMVTSQVTLTRSAMVKF